MEKTEIRNQPAAADAVIDGELVVAAPAAEPLDDEPTRLAPRARTAETATRPPETRHQTPAVRQYILLPLLFLSVALLGGLRLSSENNAFVFWRPALFCLIAAAILLVLFARARLIRLEGWFSESFSTLHNAANGAVLVALFAASAQVFNALLPEQGLPFWVFAFCFFWTLWNNLFADFEVKKLLRSLGALFGLAFVVKYMIIANLVTTGGDGFIQWLGKEALAWLLDLPRFAAGTGYIQFFTVVFYLLGLYLLPGAPGDGRAENPAGG